MSTDVVSLLMEFHILSKLNNSTFVTQHLNEIINFRSEIKITMENPKPHYLLSSKARGNILCPHSWQSNVVLLLTILRYGSSTKGEDVYEVDLDLFGSLLQPTSVSFQLKVPTLIAKNQVSSTIKVTYNSLDSMSLNRSWLTLVKTYQTNRKADVRSCTYMTYIKLSAILA